MPHPLQFRNQPAAWTDGASAARCSVRQPPGEFLSGTPPSACRQHCTGRHIAKVRRSARQQKAAVSGAYGTCTCAHLAACTNCARPTVGAAACQPRQPNAKQRRRRRMRLLQAQPQQRRKSISTKMVRTSTLGTALRLNAQRRHSSSTERATAALDRWPAPEPLQSTMNSSHEPLNCTATQICAC